VPWGARPGTEAFLSVARHWRAVDQADCAADLAYRVTSTARRDPTHAAVRHARKRFDDSAAALPTLQEWLILSHIPYHWVIRRVSLAEDGG
jgi:hypothetical protein